MIPHAAARREDIPALASIGGFARAAIRRAPALWDRWLAFCEAIDQPDYELLTEDAGPFLATFNRLRRLGVPFAPAFIDRMRDVEERSLWTDDDGDADQSDELLEAGDDPDEDGSDRALDDVAESEPELLPNDPADPRNWAHEGRGAAA
jgi:hypothetical protein